MANPDAFFLKFYKRAEAAYRHHLSDFDAPEFRSELEWALRKVQRKLKTNPDKLMARNLRQVESEIRDELGKEANGYYATTELLSKALKATGTREESERMNSSSLAICTYLSSDFHSLRIPTTEGDVDWDSAITLAAFGIHPVGLISRKKRADGDVMTPFRFFEHDFEHSNLMRGLVLTHRFGTPEALEEVKAALAKGREELAYFRSKRAKIADPVLRAKVTEIVYDFIHGETRVTLPFDLRQIVKTLKRSPENRIFDGGMSENWTTMFAYRKSEEEVELVRRALTWLRSLRR